MSYLTRTLSLMLHVYRRIYKYHSSFINILAFYRRVTSTSPENFVHVLVIPTPISLSILPTRSTIQARLNPFRNPSKNSGLGLSFFPEPARPNTWPIHSPRFDQQHIYNTSHDPQKRGMWQKGEAGVKPKNTKAPKQNAKEDQHQTTTNLNHFHPTLYQSNSF